MHRTKIEYLTHTWNPIAMRCTPVSRGCDHCWHLRMAKRLEAAFDHFADLPHDNWYTDSEKANAYRGVEPYFNNKELCDPLRLRKPARIGVQFMGDLFHESIPNDWIAAVYGVMAACPQHTFMILTKRAERMHEWFEWLDIEAHDSKWTVMEPDANWWKVHQCAIRTHEILKEHDIPTTAGTHWPLQNVLDGVSVEDQASADKRIPVLLNTPAAKSWVSYEPALGPIDFKQIDGWEIAVDLPPKIDWVVAGAETGPGARPCDPDWLRSVRDQCRAAKVPFFLKQVDAAGERELDGRVHDEVHE